MPRTVQFDRVTLQVGEVKVGPTGEVSLRLHYRVEASTQGVYLDKVVDASPLLTEAERQTIRDLAGRLQSALESQELV